jgi:hypothetical protein
MLETNLWRKLTFVLKAYVKVFNIEVIFWHIFFLYNTYTEERNQRKKEIKRKNIRKLSLCMYCARKVCQNIIFLNIYRKINLKIIHLIFSKLKFYFISTQNFHFFSNILLFFFLEHTALFIIKSILAVHLRI